MDNAVRPGRSRFDTILARHGFVSGGPRNNISAERMAGKGMEVE